MYFGKNALILTSKRCQPTEQEKRANEQDINFFCLVSRPDTAAVCS